jgi:hypothetical protein
VISDHLRRKGRAKMGNTSRTAVRGGVMAAVLAVGSWTLVGPAAAGSSAVTESVAARTSSTWTPGTEEGEDGRWVAYIECCGGFIREDVGTYETRKEARRAAKDAADEANGVMDGPGCDPPIVLC